MVFFCIGTVVGGKSIDLKLQESFYNRCKYDIYWLLKSAQYF